MHKLNSCQNGLFQKTTIQGDKCKLLIIDIALENLQTAQMPPGKSSEKSPFGLELSVSIRWWWMEECFSVQITWKILLSKINKNPGKLEFTDLRHEMPFCQERPGLLGGLTNRFFTLSGKDWTFRGTHTSIFSHKAPFGHFPNPPSPHFPSSKRLPSKIDFFKRNQTKCQAY